jgi:hypothetical protein
MSKNQDIRTLIRKASKNNTKRKRQEPKLITSLYSNDNKGLDDFPSQNLTIYAWNINGIRPSISKEYLLKFIKESKFELTIA